MKKEIRNRVVIYTGITIALIIILVELDLYAKSLGLQMDYNLLGFIGAIVGGGMTLVGVLMTVKYQKELDAENKRLSIIPCLQYNTDSKFVPKRSNETENFDSSIKCVFSVKLEKTASVGDPLFCSLKFKNVGLGHANLMKVIITTIKNGTVIESKPENSITERLILIGTEYCVSMSLGSKKDILDNDERPKYNIEIELQYQDLLKNNYKQKIKTTLFVDDEYYAFVYDGADSFEYIPKNIHQPKKYKKVLFKLQSELKEQFQKTVALNGDTMNNVLTKFIEQYIKDSQK